MVCNLDKFGRNSHGVMARPEPLSGAQHFTPVSAPGDWGFPPWLWRWGGWEKRGQGQAAWTLPGFSQGLQDSKPPRTPWRPSTSWPIWISHTAVNSRTHRHEVLLISVTSHKEWWFSIWIFPDSWGIAQLTMGFNTSHGHPECTKLAAVSDSQLTYRIQSDSPHDECRRWRNFCSWPSKRCSCLKRSGRVPFRLVEGRTFLVQLHGKSGI
jgi:hypothetical protein